MARRNFDRWVQRTCGYIYYPPDREEVSQELYWHYDDAVEELMEEGLDRESAQSTALNSMGDAETVGKLLRRAHKPWLGIVYSALQILLGLCVLAIIVVFCLTQFHRTRIEIGYLFRDIPQGDELVTYIPYSYIVPDLAPKFDGELKPLPPSGKVRCGDYTFQISDAILASHPDWEQKKVCLLLSYSSPRFWLGEPTGTWGNLYALEDTGFEHRTNDFDAMTEGEDIAEDLLMSYLYYPLDDKNMSFGYYSSKTATGSYIINFPVSDDCSWIDLICDRGEGFSIRLHIREGGSQ